MKLFSILTYNLKSTFNILNYELKIKFLFLIIVTFLTIFIETASFTLFIPLFDQIFNQGNNIPVYLKNIIDNFGIFNIKNSIQNILYFILIVFIVKSILLIYFKKFSINFTAKLERFIENNLVKQFLYQNYESYKKYESARINKELILDIVRYKGFVESTLLLVTELLIMIGIILVLLLVDKTSTIIILLVFFLFSFFYLLLTKKVFIKIGEKTQQNEKNIIQSSMEIFNLFKEIRIFNIENKFLTRFDNSLNKKLENDKDYNFLISLPRIFLELLIVFALVITFIFLLKFETSSDEILIIIGLLAVASIRIMPSISKCINSINQIKYCNSSVKIINEKLLKENKHNNEKNYNQDTLRFNNKLEIKDLNFNYEGSSFRFKKSINIEINRGEFIGVIGPSGSGKSTLLDIIMLLQENFKGSYKFDGKEINNSKNRELAKLSNNFGYVNQNIWLINDSIKNNILLCSNERDENTARLELSIKQSQLDSFIESQPNGINTIISDNGLNISGGQRQRIGIARALYLGFPIIVLDEFTSSLDIENQEKIMRDISSLKKFGKTIIQSTHNPEHHKYFDKVIDLNN